MVSDRQLPSAGCGERSSSVRCSWANVRTRPYSCTPPPSAPIGCLSSPRFALDAFAPPIHSAQSLSKVGLLEPRQTWLHPRAKMASEIPAGRTVPCSPDPSNSPLVAQSVPHPKESPTQSRYLLNDDGASVLASHSVSATALPPLE